MPTINNEGLTWSEWLAAASGGKAKDDDLRLDQRGTLRSEWENGVDPTEWRNYFDEKGV